jgi:NitT/TauT family transport system ATP-binding protein
VKRLSVVARAETRPGPSAPAAIPAAAAITVSGVSKTFRRKALTTRALEGVDLAVGKGEFLAIVGPSGCGKSTLLRIIAGLVGASEGRVEVNGHAVDAPVTDLGVVFQSPVLLDWRTVLDNVLVQLELRGLDTAKYRPRALELLDRVGLAEFGDRYPRELSGGMRQRAAIVRALVHDPRLLLMDEPFGALDALTREQMRIDLEALWLETGKTVLFVTHSIDEAVLLADRVLVMTARPGKVDRIVPVNLPRPRGIDGRKLPGFAGPADAITALFLERGVLKRALHSK